MILFTADWHVRLQAKNVPIDWSLNRYRMFFAQVHALEESVNLHIIGGDLFDKTPTMEELDLYFEFVEGVKVQTLIYAGNHEATKKGKTFLTYLKRATAKANPLVQIIDDVYETQDYIIVPYEFIHKKKFWSELDKSKVLFSHIRGEIPPHVKPEINLELVQDFPVVYLGDLHSHSNCQANLVYPGSPMTTSFHRDRVETGYILIEENDLTSWTWHKFDLPQLIRKTVTDPEEMVATDYDHTIYELEGNIVDLAKVKDAALLDKKLTKRSSEAALILTKDMTMVEELVEYWRYILELPEEEIERGVKVYHDFAKTT